MIVGSQVLDIVTTVVPKCPYSDRVSLLRPSQTGGALYCRAWSPAKATSKDSSNAADLEQKPIFCGVCF